MTKLRHARVWLPIVQTIVAAIFGGIGIWHRKQILDQTWLGTPLWNTTARFHVWPWQYKLAFIINFPAALCAMVLEWPVGRIWPGMPQTLGWFLCLPIIALLWYRIGMRIDRSINPNLRLGILLCFMAVSAAGILLPGYSSFGAWSIVVWFGFLIAWHFANRIEIAILHA